MRIALYLRNLDEEYQISMYRSMKAECERLDIDLVCVQRGLTPSAEELAADGAILLTSVLLKRGMETEFPLLKAAVGPLPCVSVANRLPGIPSIIIHNMASMEALMEHLISFHGYEKFLYIGGPEGHRDNTVREHVFRDAIARASATRPRTEGTVVNCGFREALAVHAMREYIRDHPADPLDAVVAANDNMAIGALKVISSSGIPAWNRCAVTGFDDIQQARLVTPPLTTVSQPLDDLARQAVRSVHALISGNRIPDVTQVDSSLVIRASCGCDGNGPGANVPRASESPAAPPESAMHPATSDALYDSLRFTELLRSVSVFGQELTTAASMEELVGYLKSFLDDIGIENFSLLLNAEPKADRDGSIRVVYRRSGRPGRTEGIRVGAPERLTIHDFFGANAEFDAMARHNPCVFNLQSGEDEIGMIVYEAPERAQPHVCGAGVFIANTVRRLQLLEEEKERSRLLESEVMLRTKDLLETNRKLQREAGRRLEVEAEVLRISEMERLRFSLDLHDDICQRLAGISMFSKSLAHECAPHECAPHECAMDKEAADSADALRELSSMIDETLTRTRQYAHESFPVELDSLGLNEALEVLCSSLERQTGCACEYSWDVGADADIPVAKRINLYRIVQEALHNVVKHSEATLAGVTVRAADGVLCVRVKDNGKGIHGDGTANDAQSRDGTPHSITPRAGDKKKPHVGIGLKSMEYRAHQIGASYRVSSSDKTGTEITIRLPLGQTR
jgi:signal transduction histidine kinase/DNA-binding LacI/PurR family transcriptional regulator